jgi:hypothetical protein
VTYPPPPPGQQPPQQEGSAIAVTAKFMPMAFFFFFVKPVVEIDGYRVPAKWGRNVVPVPAGRHNVHVHTPYFLPSRVGPADQVVDVAPGQVAELEYRSPLIVFLQGAMGPPPQKYPGMAAMIALYVVAGLMLVCLCATSLIGSSGTS